MELDPHVANVSEVLMVAPCVVLNVGDGRLLTSTANRTAHLMQPCRICKFKVVERAECSRLKEEGKEGSMFQMCQDQGCGISYEHLDFNAYS